MIINKGDLVKHTILGNGIIQKVDTNILHVKFESMDRIGKFMLEDFSSIFRKYFKEDGVYKEYNPLTHTWYNEDGFDDEGFDQEGYNREGFNREGFSKQGIHFKTKDKYNLEGFDVNGYDQNGLDKEGIHYVKKYPFRLYEIVIDHIKGNINKDSFRYALIRVGKQTKDEIIRDELRELYKSLVGFPNYWEEFVKKRIVSKISWDLFSPSERTDIPPMDIPNKIRSAYCWYCSGSLYSDIHQRCPKCDWLICPYDKACGCGSKYKYARNDFMN